MSKSLNQANIIGNLTRDVELRMTAQGTPVATFGIATNRSWMVEGERHEETEFHNIVAWAKLAELCNQLLHKGSKVYVQGRLSTRKWQGSDGRDNYKTEIHIEDMMMLDKKRDEEAEVNLDEIPV